MNRRYMLDDAKDAVMRREIDALKKELELWATGRRKLNERGEMVDLKPDGSEYTYRKNVGSNGNEHERKYPIVRVYRTFDAVDGQIFDEYEGCQGWKFYTDDQSVIHVVRLNGTIIATHNTWSHVRLFDKDDHIE